MAEMFTWPCLVRSEATSGTILANLQIQLLILSRLLLSTSLWVALLFSSRVHLPAPLELPSLEEEARFLTWE